MQEVSIEEAAVDLLLEKNEIIQNQNAEKEELKRDNKRLATQLLAKTQELYKMEAQLEATKDQFDALMDKIISNQR